MKAILHFFSQYFKNKPMIFIGLKFCIWYGLIHILAQAILTNYPSVLYSYLREASRFSVSILSGIGLPYEMYDLKEGVGIWNGDFLSVIVNETCGGVPIYKLYIALVLAFIPGIYKKSIGAILGLPILLFVNMIRIVGIILVKEYYPVYFKFAHEIVFVYLMYGLAIYMWYKTYQWQIKKE